MTIRAKVLLATLRAPRRYLARVMSQPARSTDANMPFPLIEPMDHAVGPRRHLSFQGGRPARNRICQSAKSSAGKFPACCAYNGRLAAFLSAPIPRLEAL